MSKKIFAFLALFSVLFLNTQSLIAFAADPVDPDLYTQYGSVTKDSYVDEDTTSNHNTTNYGQFSSVDVKSNTSKNRRALVQYDLSFLSPSQEIQSAEMFVYMNNEASSNSNRTYGVSQILNSWVEGNGGTDNIPLNEVRWANKPNASTSPTSTTVITPGTKWVSFDVTADVRNLAKGQGGNAGWMIQDMTENSSTSFLAQFYSKEYSGTACAASPSPWGCRPYVKVVYKQYNGGIFGTVWNDTNHDGIKDEGELPKQGEVISLTGPVATTTVTNADGIYYIPTGLPSGTYTVCRDSSNTTIQTAPLSGVNCANGSYGASVSIVGADGLSVGPDFGVFQGGSLKVILNTNPTLTEDSFQVALLKDATTTTAHTFFGPGEYVFTGLVPGEYSLSQVMPSWWAQSGVSCVSGETSTSGGSFSVVADSQTVCMVSDVKTASLTVTNYIEPVQGTYSFTLSLPSDIGDTLMFDPVSLGNAESHTFTGIIPGTYNLLEIVDGGPSGETAVCFIGDTMIDPRVASLTIPAGARIQCTYNHGAFAVVQGTVFDDVKANGIQDAEDTALSGWNVKLFKITEDMITTGEGDSIISTPIQVVTEIGSKITTGAGYIFGQLNPGIYKVCEEKQAGWTQTFPATGEDCTGSLGHFITLDFGSVITKHFGNFSKGTVMGIVFADGDNNGVQDSGETGLSGITVHLGDRIAQTDSSGNYQFTDVNPGEYVLTVDAPAHSSYSTPTSGNYNLSVLSQGSYVHKDFGVFSDTTAPVSSFTSPNPDSSIEDDFIAIAGSTQDDHGVTGTTLAYAPYSTGGDSPSCGAYTDIVNLINAGHSNLFNWSYNWTPAEDGVYCLKAHGQDVAGNTEASPFVANITFKKKVVATTTDTTGNTGTTGGTGGGSSGGNGGNGPIVGSFGGGNTGGGSSFSPVTTLGVGGTPDGAVLPPQTNNTQTDSTKDNTTESSGIVLALKDTSNNSVSSGLTDSSRASTTVGTTTDTTEDTSNLAAVGVLGEWNNWYWLWILIVLLIIAGVYYSTRERNK